MAGMVMVNLPTAGVDYHVPFGGRKRSSHGLREQGTYAKELFDDREDGWTCSLSGLSRFYYLTSFFCPSRLACNGFLVV